MHDDHSIPNKTGIAFTTEIAGWVIIILVTMVFAESLSYMFVHLRRNYFSDEEKSIGKLYARLDGYPEFLERAYVPSTGWDTVPDERREEKACDGRRVAFTTGPDRSRRTPSVGGGPEVLLFGDSYTLGQEVGDQETFAWLLSERLGVQVRNHGVAGYSPVQATLKFERLAEAYPSAKLAVLGIMHADVKRMLGRYRPVESRQSAQLFGFKPYTQDARIVPNPNGPTPATTEQVPALARKAFAEDFFARPARAFPFSLRVVQLLTSRAFYLELGEHRSRTYRQYYEDPHVMADLAVVAERFVTVAEAHGIKPIIAFLPETRFDRGDAAPAIATLTARFGDRAIVSAVGDEPGDWTRYNIKDGHCHPSPYGHEMIAAHLARLMQPVLDTARMPARASQP